MMDIRVTFDLTIDDLVAFHLLRQNLSNDEAVVLERLTTNICYNPAFNTNYSLASSFPLPAL